MALIAEIFFVFVAPVLLVYVHPGNELYRRLLFILAIAGAALLAFLHGLTLGDMGMRTDNTVSALTVYVPAALLSLVVVYVLAKITHARANTMWREDGSFFFVAAFLSIGQQFLYQAVLLQLIAEPYGRLPAIFTTALLFAVLHTLFPRPIVSFFFSLAAGLMFATLYTLEPNFLVASLTHFVLNVVVVSYSFFVFARSDATMQNVI